MAFQGARVTLFITRAPAANRSGFRLSVDLNGTPQGEQEFTDQALERLLRLEREWTAQAGGDEPWNLCHIGRELFELWLAPVWPQVAGPTAAMPWNLIIASDVPEILALPWELILPPEAEHLGFDQRHRVRRFPLPGNLPEAPGGAMARPIRALFMALVPTDQPDFDFEREEAALMEALPDNGAAARLGSSDYGTFSDLQQKLNQFRPHVVHLMGRILQGEDGTEFLGFEGDGGGTDCRSGDDLYRIFAGSGVQCIFLSLDRWPAGLLQSQGIQICHSLIRAGIPAVVLWPPTADGAARGRLLTAFYQALAAGRAVDAALAQARHALLPRGNEGARGETHFPMLFSATQQEFLTEPEPGRPVEGLADPGRLDEPLYGLGGDVADFFVGRRRPLQRLLAALRSGETRLLFLTGMGGIGKSTLALMLARKLVADGYTLVPVPIPRGGAMAAATMLNRFGDVLLRQGRRSEWQTLRDETIPVAERLRLVHHWLAAGRFVVVLDDLDEILDVQTREIKDSAFAGLVAALAAEGTGRSRVMITARYLPAVASESTPGLRAEPLRDLSQWAVMKYLLADSDIARRYHDGTLDRSLLGDLYRVVGGTPRFLKQLRSLLKQADTQTLQREIAALERHELAQGGGLGKSRDKYCDDLIMGVLLAFLDEPSRRALVRTAVFRIPVTVAALAAVTGLSEAEVAVLAEGWQNSALASAYTRADGERLWAVYGLLRGWLTSPERLTAEERREAHRLAGRFLTDLERENREAELGINWVECLSEAYFHHIEAGEYALARSAADHISEYLFRSSWYGELIRLNADVLRYEVDPGPMSWVARAYLSEGALDDAEAWYKQCLEAAGAKVPAEEGICWLGLAEIDLRRGQPDSALDRAQKALTLFQQTGQRIYEADAWHLLAGVEESRRNRPQARAYVERALALREGRSALMGKANDLQMLARLDVRDGDLPSAHKRLEEAVAVRDDAAHLVGSAAVRLQLAELLDDMGDGPGAVREANLALEICQALGDEAGEAQVLMGKAGILSNLGDFPRARVSLEAAAVIHRRRGDQAGEACVLGKLCEVAIEQADFDGALEVARQHLELYRALGDHAKEVAALNTLATAHTQRGEIDEAEQRLVEATEISKQHGASEGEWYTQYNLGRLEFRQGRYGAAQARYEQLLAQAEADENLSNQARALHQLASLFRRLGDRPASREKAERELELVRRIGDRRLESATLRLLGMLATDEEQYEEARRRFAEARALSEPMGDLAGVMDCVRQLGQLELNQEHFREARRLFRECLAHFRTVKDRSGEAETLHCLAVVDLNEGRVDPARRELLAAARINREIRDFPAAARNYRQLGEVPGTFADAKDAFCRALDLFASFGQPARVAEVVGRLWVLSRQGKHPRALELLLLWHVILRDEGLPNAQVQARLNETWAALKLPQAQSEALVAKMRAEYSKHGAPAVVRRILG